MSVCESVFVFLPQDKDDKLCEFAEIKRIKIIAIVEKRLICFNRKTNKFNGNYFIIGSLQKMAFGI